MQLRHLLLWCFIGLMPFSSWAQQEVMDEASEPSTRSHVFNLYAQQDMMDEALVPGQASWAPARTSFLQRIYLEAHIGANYVLNMKSNWANNVVRQNIAGDDWDVQILNFNIGLIGGGELGLLHADKGVGFRIGVSYDFLQSECTRWTIDSRDNLGTGGFLTPRPYCDAPDTQSSTVWPKALIAHTIMANGYYDVLVNADIQPFVGLGFGLAMVQMKNESTAIIDANLMAASPHLGVKFYLSNNFYGSFKASWLMIMRPRFQLFRKRSGGDYSPMTEIQGQFGFIHIPKATFALGMRL